MHLIGTKGMHMKLLRTISGGKWMHIVTSIENVRFDVVTRQTQRFRLN